METYQKEILLNQLKSDLEVEKSVLQALQEESKKTFIMQGLLIISQTRISALQREISKLEDTSPF